MTTAGAARASALRREAGCGGATAADGTIAAAMRRLASYRTHLILFGLGLVVFGATAGSRVAQQSSDPHFVLLADAWLNGQLAIDPPPEIGDDWAIVETVRLKDGQKVRGRRMQTERSFATTGGERIPMADVAERLDQTHYVSFPPFPAVLMLPQAALGGRDANDVIPTVIVAALILPLAFVAFRRLAAEGLSERTPRDDLLLTVALAFGTVLFFSAVQGRVWYTAHVVGVALALGYIACSIGARYPILAGLCLGAAALTRTPMAFMFPLFLFEAWRVSGGRAGLRDAIGLAARFATPVAILAAIAMAYNAARFDELTEFGHAYLAVRQQAQIETTGMFDWSYLGRNLAVALTLLPQLSTEAPYVTISGHGMALWVTTPIFFMLLWPRERGPLHLPLWITALCVALPSLLYQNSGWFQFGYRFSLDYTPLFFALLAVGARPLRWPAKTLVALAIAINLFGALTFARSYEYYDASRSAYECVLPH